MLSACLRDEVPTSAVSSDIVTVNSQLAENLTNKSVVMPPFILIDVTSYININPGTMIIISRFMGKNIQKEKFLSRVSA
jgi:hypothetical protein